MSRKVSARQRQERWEHHMHGLCILDNHLNVEMEMASHRSVALNHLVEQANRVKDLWLEFQRKSDNGCVLEDTAVQMAIEQHGLQSHNFHQPQSHNITVSYMHVSFEIPRVRIYVNLLYFQIMPSNKPPDIDCDDVFNQAVSAAIVTNGLMATTQQNYYM